jgi:hypothetical protein
MTSDTEQKPRVLKFLRSRNHPRSVLIDENLNLYPFDVLQGGGYIVIDPETGEDITRILMA